MVTKYNIWISKYFNKCIDLHLTRVYRRLDNNFTTGEYLLVKCQTCCTVLG